MCIFNKHLSCVIDSHEFEKFALLHQRSINSFSIIAYHYFSGYYQNLDQWALSSNILFKLSYNKSWINKETMEWNS